MIAPAVVAEVRCLLAEGELSQRRIAKITGISRGTVAAIASGRRPDYEARRPAAEEEDPLAPTGPLERCPGCGGMVYLPCRLCNTRAILATSPQLVRRRRANRLDEPLGLDLNEEHRARYEEVRARRRAEVESRTCMS